MSAAGRRLACTRNCTAIIRQQKWEAWAPSRENMPLLRRGALRRCPLTITAKKLSVMSFRLVLTGHMMEMPGRDHSKQGHGVAWVETKLMN